MLDEPVVKYYRKLLRYGFQHCGRLENPSIFLDSIGENIPICSQVAQAYMHLYINIRDNIIQDIRYLCMCEPTANVAVEILCTMIKGKTIEEVKGITVDDFSRVLGGKSKDFEKSSKGLIELLNRGITQYQTKN